MIVQDTFPVRKTDNLEIFTSACSLQYLFYFPSVQEVSSAYYFDMSDYYMVPPGAGHKQRPKQNGTHVT